MEFTYIRFTRTDSMYSVRWPPLVVSVMHSSGFRPAVHLSLSPLFPTLLGWAARTQPVNVTHQRAAHNVTTRPFRAIIARTHIPVVV